ncbi:MAG: hypothetical protein PVI06_04710 [Desulfobacterales bacterium]|jgi:hypothetical protein
MISENYYSNNKTAWRKKARLNICIAKDLANSFGGKKADYLKRLNHKLKLKIEDNQGLCLAPFRMAA